MRWELKQIEMNFVYSRINVSLSELWRVSYALAKNKMPSRLPAETYEQYYRDLGISTLFEFAEQVKQKAEEMTRMAIDEDH